MSTLSDQEIFLSCIYNKCQKVKLQSEAKINGRTLKKTSKKQNIAGPARQVYNIKKLVYLITQIPINMMVP